MGILPLRQQQKTGTTGFLADEQISEHSEGR
jgi:hypothetical protein